MSGNQYFQWLPTGAATETTKAKIVAAYAAHNVDITNGEGTAALSGIVGNG